MSIAHSSERFTLSVEHEIVEEILVLIHFHQHTVLGVTVLSKEDSRNLVEDLHQVAIHKNEPVRNARSTGKAHIEVLLDSFRKSSNDVVWIAVEGVITVGNRVVVAVLDGNESTTLGNLNRDHRRSVLVFPLLLATEIISLDLFDVLLDAVQDVVVLESVRVIKGAEFLPGGEVLTDLVLLLQSICISTGVPCLAQKNERILRILLRLWGTLQKSHQVGKNGLRV